MGIQRKKQYPDLAYRTSEVIADDRALPSKDVVDSRARSEERGNDGDLKSGPRSRSAEPSVGRQHQKMVMIQSYPPLASGRGALMPKMEELPSLAEGVQKNTEYRSQFAWPRHSGSRICTARKSISMGLIKALDQPDYSALPRAEPIEEVPVHKSSAKDKELSAIIEKPVQDSKKKAKTEYKAKYKPFTSYVYIDGQWKKTSRLVKIPENQGSSTSSHPWYSEVMERLQRANEYKCRGHGHPVYGEQLSSIYTKQNEGAPLVRPKKDHPEMPLSTVPPESKKSESKKKEKREKREKPVSAPAEKKLEKERRKAQEPMRPKSAEPGRNRKPRPPHRPQTAPPPAKEKLPAPVPAHHAYAKKAAAKATQSDMKPKSTSRPPTSKKPKEDTSRSGLPSDGRASRTSHHPHPSSGAKVWLQAGAPVHSPLDVFKGKHSDAVRPSTLLPPKSLPPSMDDEKKSIEHEGKEPKTEDFPHVAPAPVPLTHVQTPEEVTGVKSPEPENWTVPLDKGKKLQWTESSNIEPLLSLAKTASPKVENLEKGDTSKNMSELAESGKTASSTVTSQEVKSATAPSSARMTTADVLDRARSRLDQFWGKK